ncbi:hypothetical protein EYF80_051823 [Liparis tanakae]|uniref:Uncharacterized protein n=1 Tax=Liparis tanakae TaxID=230148 RepID=A0A4Z2F9Z9_9TELE|nr:hypothetical protein EYF80_051823 [Liparis tanakae]
MQNTLCSHSFHQGATGNRTCGGCRRCALGCQAVTTETFCIIDGALSLASRAAPRLSQQSFCTAGGNREETRITGTAPLTGTTAALHQPDSRHHSPVVPRATPPPDPHDAAVISLSLSLSLSLSSLSLSPSLLAIDSRTTSASSGPLNEAHCAACMLLRAAPVLRDPSALCQTKVSLQPSVWPPCNIIPAARTGGGVDLQPFEK